MPLGGSYVPPLFEALSDVAIWHAPLVWLAMPFIAVLARRLHDVG